MFWNYNGISINKTINIEFVKQNLNKNWTWSYLSQTIKLEDIISNPDLFWSYNYMSYNKTITFEFILQNMNKEWNWGIIFSNNHILNVFPHKLVND